MRKSKTILWSIGVILSMVGCGAKTTVPPDNTVPPTVEQGGTENVVTNESTGEAIDESANAPSDAPIEEMPPRLINISNIEMDSSINSFFGDNYQEAMVQMEPLLISAISLYANPEITVFTGGADDDLDLKWQIVIALISNFGEGNPALVKDDSQNYIVTEAIVGDYFNHCFAGNTTGAPEIAEAYRDMYSGMTGEYTIPANMDLPRVFADLKNISLSKASSADDSSMSATMEFELRSPLREDPEHPYGTISIEVVANPESPYGYALQSLLFESK